MGLIKSAQAPPSVIPFSMRDVEEHARSLIIRAREQAESLLEEAQREGERLKQEMSERGIAEGRRQGFEIGMEEGKKSGHAAALAEHGKAMGDLTSALTNLLSQLDASRRDLESNALREVISLASAVARRVTKRQSVIDPTVLQANLVEALRFVVHAADVRIILHPSQKQTLTAELPNLRQQWPNLQHIELLEDPSVEPGGCRVLTRGGEIDAEIGGQLDRVIAELLPDNN